MKNQTKLWFLIIVSAFCSLFIFIAFGFIFGDIWDKGYDLNKLNALSDQTLTAIEQPITVSKETIQPILDNAHMTHPAIRFEWIDATGQKIYDTAGEYENYDFQKIIHRFLGMPENLWGENEAIYLAHEVTKNDETYYLLMSLPSEAMKQRQIYLFFRTFKVFFIFLFPLILSFLVPYLLSIWFFSSTNKRISKLNHALNQLSIHGDVIVLENNAKDEIGQLTTHYNSMAQRIQNQAAEITQFESRRKQLLSNLSHDLRTPLTMILGYAETIRNGLYKDNTELQVSAKIIWQRSRYMDKLLDQLLDLTKQNAEILTLHLASHNLSEQLRKIVAEYLLFLDGQNYTVDVDIPDTEIEAFIDAELIERVIRNLLDNALRYGKNGHYLGISLEETQHEIRIGIKDKGKGIELAEQEKIFERFYRADGGRNGEGLGVGLSIVKEIVELHHGSVKLTSIPYEQTIFLITLPKN